MYASLAANFVKKYNLKPQTELIQELEESCVRYMLREFTWFQINDKLERNYMMLGYAATKMFENNQKQEAFTIISSHLNMLDFIDNQKLKKQY